VGGKQPTDFSKGTVLIKKIDLTGKAISLEL